MRNNVLLCTISAYHDWWAALGCIAVIYWTRRSISVQYKAFIKKYTNKRFYNEFESTGVLRDLVLSYCTALHITAPALHFISGIWRTVVSLASYDDGKGIA